MDLYRTSDRSWAGIVVGCRVYRARDESPGRRRAGAVARTLAGRRSAMPSGRGVWMAWLGGASRPTGAGRPRDHGGAIACAPMPLVGDGAGVRGREAQPAPRPREGNGPKWRPGRWI